MNNELIAIYSMWKREVIRFLRSKSRIIGSLATPFLFLAVLGSGLNGAMGASAGHGVNYLDFITPGVLAMVLLTGSIFSGSIVIMDRQFGFLKETLIAPVSRTSIVIGKAIGGATTAVIQGCIMLLIAVVVLGVKINLMSLLFAIPLMALICMALVSLGVALASMIEDMQGFHLIMNFLVMPMFFLSGALFPLNNSPQLLQYLSYLDPLTYAVESLRYLLLGTSNMPITLSVSVLVIFFVATNLWAAYMFGKIED